MGHDVAATDDPAPEPPLPGRDPDQEQEWLRQSNLIYGGLIAVGLVLVQPFLTVPSLDASAKVCVVAFAVAIPLLAALVRVDRQETFRHRLTGSPFVSITQTVAQMAAFTGVVAGFWHVLWFAGVAVLVAGVVAVGVHTAGYVRLESDDAR